MLLFLLLLGTGTCAFIIGTATHALPIPELRADPLPSDLDNYVGDEVFVFLFVCLFSHLFPTVFFSCSISYKERQ